MRDADGYLTVLVCHCNPFPAAADRDGLLLWSTRLRIVPRGSELCRGQLAGADYKHFWAASSKSAVAWDDVVHACCLLQPPVAALPLLWLHRLPSKA